MKWPVCCPDTQCSVGLVYDANGGEGTSTNCIDPAAAGLVQYPVRQTFLTAAAVTQPVSGIGNLFVNDTTAAGSPITVVAASGVPAVLPINPKYPLWTVMRTGPTAAFTDTWDSAANFILALNPSSNVGFVYHARVCNYTAYAETIAAGTGVTLSGTNVVGGGVCVPFTVTILSATSIGIAGG